MSMESPTMTHGQVVIFICLKCLLFSTFNSAGDIYIMPISFAVRSASPPAPAEPSMAPHPKSFMDVSGLDLVIVRETCLKLSCR